VSAGSHNAVSASGAPSGSISAIGTAAATAQTQTEALAATDVKFCAIDDPGCEACQ
jgi:ribonucleoside-diphosphate reductase alpha chain